MRPSQIDYDWLSVMEFASTALGLMTPTTLNLQIPPREVSEFSWRIASEYGSTA